MLYKWAFSGHGIVSLKAVRKLYHALFVGGFDIDFLIALVKRRRYQYKNKISSLTDNFLSNQLLFFSIIMKTKDLLLN